MCAAEEGKSFRVQSKFSNTSTDFSAQGVPKAKMTIDHNDHAGVVNKRS